MDISKFIEHGSKLFLPNLSVDIVIVGFRDGKIRCLLLKLKDKWLLPGGYIQRDESVDNAVCRILETRTGLQDPHLKFLSVFGDNERRFGDEINAFFRASDVVYDSDIWVNNRFVTLAYYSLVDIAMTHPSPGDMDEDIDWFPIDELPDMWMDHKSIVLSARNRIKEDVKHEHMSYRLLPDAFTMPELHLLHQVILGEKIDRSRFQKKMLATGLFDRLPRKKQGTPGRNPYQYRLKPELQSGSK